MIAARDPQIGRAIIAIHRSPAGDRSVETLARVAGMSCSAFSARFTSLVGQPAMQYLATWRMHLARQRLIGTGQPISAIAAELGFLSEQAFNRAFKRVFGEPPGQARLPPRNAHGYVVARWTLMKRRPVMPPSAPVLHMLCGKIASGKSTLAARLARTEGAVLIAEDAWLDALFSDQMTTGAGFLRCSARLQEAMGPHLGALLTAGVSVVLDFQANTVESRAWMRGIIDATGAAHRLHVLDVPNAVCLARLGARSASGDHPFAVTEAQFERFSRHFVAPTPEEGFEIVRHDLPE